MKQEPGNLVVSAAGIAERIRLRLTELQTSARAASINTNRGPDVIRNLLRAIDAGRAYNPRIDTLTAIAKALKVNPYWLQFGDLYDKENLNYNADTLQSGGLAAEIYSSDTPDFVGIVETGVYRGRETTYQTSPIYRLDAHLPVGVDPRFPQLHQIAWLARGDGGEEVDIVEGMIVTGVPRVAYVRAVGPLRWGMLVVFEQTKDNGRLVETSIRRLFLGSTELELVSCGGPKSETTILSVQGHPADGPESIVGVITGAHKSFLDAVLKPRFY